MPTTGLEVGPDRPDLARAGPWRVGDRGPPRRTGPHLPSASQADAGRSARAAAGRLRRRGVEQRDRDRGPLPTKIGILHRITKALSEFGLDIRHATVQSIGMEVVDTFYVRNWSAELVTDSVHRRRSSEPSSTPSPDAFVGSAACAADRWHGPGTPLTTFDVVSGHVRDVRAPAILPDGASAGRRSLAPGSASPRASTSASVSKRCCTSPADIKAAADALQEAIEDEIVVQRETDHFVQEWMESSAKACPGYVTPKVAIGAIVGNDAGELLLVQRKDSGIWLYPTGGPTSATRRRGRGQGGRGGDRHRVRAAAAARVVDGQRMGFSRFGMYMLLFHCRATGGELRPTPARDRRCRLVRRRCLPGSNGRRAVVGADGVRRDRRGRGVARHVRPRSTRSPICARCGASAGH